MSRKVASAGAVSDRVLNRAIAVLVVALAIGLPAIALVYYLDRHVDAGPSIADRTITAAEAAVRTNPNMLSARLALAAAYAGAGRQSDAATQYTEVLGGDATNRAALLGRADTYRSLGQLDAAAADYQALVDVASGGEMANVDVQLEAAYFGLGSIALAQDRPRDAATLLANALVIDRTDADALDLMGTALIAIGDNWNAVDALRDAVALVPTGWCDPYTHLGQAYTALGEPDGATYASGMVAFCEGRSDDAMRLLQSVPDGPFTGDVLIGQGLVAEDLGDTQAAIEFYTRVYDSDPSNFLAVTGLNRLGATVSPVPVPPTAPAASPVVVAGQ
jgi:tetratricopeptide (TPR) repeat protein